MMMVEKMARAIAGSPDAWYGNGDRCISKALAALKAMREPTDAMLAGAASSESHKLVAKAFWLAMIDTAIAEHAATAIGNRRA